MKFLDRLNGKFLNFFKELPDLALWEKVGEPKTLAKGYGGRKLLSQEFRNPRTKALQDFTMYSQPESSVVLALTENLEVISTLQYKQAINDLTLEVAAGNSDNIKDKPEVVAQKELLEETGYQAHKMISLGHIWVNTRNAWDVRNIFLALGCIRVKESQKDPNEEILRILIPFKDWEAMIRKGIIIDAQSIVATYKSLPYVYPGK